MKKLLRNSLCIILFASLGILSSNNAQSKEDLIENEQMFCSTAWIPRAGYFLIRCGICDILLNKQGSYAGSTCPPN